MKIKCIKSYIDNNKFQYGCFTIEPLEIGQGLTLGNVLRRTLLSHLITYQATGLRINNLKHEFLPIAGLKEDYLELVLNIKEVIFKEISTFEKSKDKIMGVIATKGPIIINAGMIKLNSTFLTIVNPKKYIGTLVDNSDLYLEIDLEKNHCLSLNTSNIIDLENTLSIENKLIPIKRVNFSIKLINDITGALKESLSLEIWTNGSITPSRSLKESIKIIIDIFSFLFLNNECLNISNDLNLIKNEVI
jgi:DNA-directed RNA polymerase subunit alpha